MYSMLPKNIDKKCRHHDHTNSRKSGHTIVWRIIIIIIIIYNACHDCDYLIIYKSGCRGTVKDIFNDISTIKPWQKCDREEINHSKTVIPLKKCIESECPPCRLPFPSKIYSREKREPGCVHLCRGHWTGVQGEDKKIAFCLSIH